MREVDQELFDAVRQDNLSKVQRCVDRGADIYAKSANGNKALHTAAFNGHKNVVEFFLNRGLSINDPGCNGFTPLHLAAEAGHLEVTEFLIAKKADIYARNADGSNALHVAAANGHKDIVEFFLGDKCGTYVRIMDTPGISIASYQGVSIDTADTDGWTSLHYASCNGELEVVKFLVSKGANIYAENIYKNKALHTAALHGRKNVVEFFLNRGLDVKERGELGYTPLHSAAKEGRIEVIKFLLAKGASIHDRSTGGSKPVHTAALEGHKNVVEFFLNQGISINDTGEIGFTLLHFAAQEGQREVIEFLLRRGADADIRNECGEKPSDVARRKGHSSIVGLLSPYESCVILSTHSEKKQQEKFLHSISNADVRQVKQGLYLPSFEARNVKINGKCTAITRSLSQALLLQNSKSFLNNLETSAKIYERIAQGKQISKREERETFAFSKLLNNFGRQLDSATSSLPSSLVHTKSYKTLDDLSNYIAGIKGDFAIHLVTSNHVVAIYRVGDNYAYFDSNTAFISGLKSVDQLMEVVEKGAGYKIEKKGLLVEHFDVEQANDLLSSEDKQTLAKEIKTERQLLAEQDKELGLIKINGQEISRVQLYDFGTKISVKGSMPILINADMKLSSKKFQDHLDKKEVSMTAREYLDSLKGSKNVEEIVKATQAIPFEGSKREIRDAEKTRKLKQSSSELAKGAINHILAAVSLTSINQSKGLLSRTTDETTGRPESYLSSTTISNQPARTRTPENF
ncbi:ankyrin repeat domain-containing protein [Candidatus Wolbachia massiliensis]|uniref:Ankyrin repeat domain-containing protein n=1 Tax=Candidatus Wolbachia massiliensis TaxID=1845000 RepID=A0A7M3U1W1_9RICK|nr:ankyrin repeat domain-containing protein [Candidatus Wolbachia massiliensis]QOD38396.1 ankyrin repeat domain-containing protein [Candidatus Wolbachia massiliensis]